MGYLPRRLVTLSSLLFLHACLPASTKGGSTTRADAGKGPASATDGGKNPTPGTDGGRSPPATDGGKNPPGTDGGKNPPATDGGNQGPLPPGDHFFDSVGTTTGTSDAGTAATSFRVVIATFDPAYAANHSAGTPGSNSQERAAAGSVEFGSQSIALTGTWTSDGTVTLSGGGFTFTGKVSGATITGSFSGGATGVFAGADITVGQVGIFFGAQDDGTALDVVVSKSGVVTGVIGGSSGGYIGGTASGDALSYSWQANGATGTGTATVGSGGQLSGSSKQNSCAQSEWSCGTGSSPGSCNCACFGSSCAGSPGLTACAGLTCCGQTYNAGSDTLSCQCVTDAFLASMKWDCATFQSLGWPAVSKCGVSMTPSCTPSWSATPAPCPKSAGGACLSYDFANYAGTCAAGNAAACTPPPGGCSCPAGGGCNTCGKISACCVP